MHADIISPDVLSSSPNLPSSLLPGMCSTFNLVLMWLRLFFFFFFYTLNNCIRFAKYQNESATVASACA